MQRFAAFGLLPFNVLFVFTAFHFMITVACSLPISRRAWSAMQFWRRFSGALDAFRQPYIIFIYIRAATS